MAKGWNIDPASFAGLVEDDVRLRQRTIAIQLLNEIVQRSPVGNPELWAINATAVQYNKAVGEWNESLYADPANLTKTGRLRKKSVLMTAWISGVRLSIAQEPSGHRILSVSANLFIPSPPNRIRAGQ